MAKARSSGDEPVAPTSATGLDRATNVLALLLVKGMKNSEAIVSLSRAGFQPREVAELLGTSANTVSVTLYQAKQATKKQAGKKKAGRG
jgi:DNA-directed RNA polymerase specialized sigma24 family protein